MKGFQHLIIRDTRDNLKSLMSKMRDYKGTFYCQKSNSKEYAKNIFLKSDEALCMKTDRKSLFESIVWLVLFDNELRVTNITSADSLGREKYNLVLTSFARDVIEKLKDQSTKVILSGENVEMADIMSQNSYQKFNKWFLTANSDNYILHPMDQARFMDLIVSLKENDPDFDISTFRTLILEMMRPELEDVGNNIAVFTEFGIELLKHYDNNR